ncbi:MAG: hypothetical protein II815_05510, partial [Bacteroidales bacterium]|nr:hypothetical protein [Bacteroidales bacterium]
FDISGKWGQRCVANPKTGLMVTYLSDNPDRSGELADIARRFVASARSICTIYNSSFQHRNVISFFSTAHMFTVRCALSCNETNLSFFLERK